MLRRLRKVGRFWKYTPTRSESETFQRLYRAAMKDAMEEASGGPMLEPTSPPGFVMFGGGSWPTAMVYLEPPRGFWSQLFRVRD